MDDVTEGWNFGPKDDDAKPVEWILNAMVKQWGENASWQLDTNPQPHEAKFLKLDISKVKTRLHWGPTWHLSQTLNKIIEWHKSWINKKDMRLICMQEINDYMNDMNKVH